MYITSTIFTSQLKHETSSVFKTKVIGFQMITRDQQNEPSQAVQQAEKMGSSTMMLLGTLSMLFPTMLMTETRVVTMTSVTLTWNERREIILPNLSNPMTCAVSVTGMGTGTEMTGRGKSEDNEK